MAEVLWTPRALADVQRLHRFLAARNADAARRAVATLRSSVRILTEQPAVGRPVDGMDPEFREWVIDFGDSGYVLIYRVESAGLGDTRAVVLAVRHQREAGLLRERRSQARITRFGQEWRFSLVRHRA
jgi:plasmid stabilization system protein ParE